MAELLNFDLGKGRRTAICFSFLFFYGVFFFLAPLGIEMRWTCQSNFVISQGKWQINAEMSRQTLQSLQ